MNKNNISFKSGTTDANLVSPVKPETALNNVVRNALFLEAIRNLNWSRGYSWYVELDGVPSPFQRGGVIGLPVTSINFQVNKGQSFTWESAVEEFSVPLKKSLCTVQLTLLDDEQGTIFTFFERWFNNIYNSNYGILPVAECCKCLSIYKLKSTRTKVHRNIVRDIYGPNPTYNFENVNSRNFLVYPEGPLIEDEQLTSEPRKYSIELVIVKQQDPDFGHPNSRPGTTSLFGKIINDNKGQVENNFLSKLADYI